MENAFVTINQIMKRKSNEQFSLIAGKEGMEHAISSMFIVETADDIEQIGCRSLVYLSVNSIVQGNSLYDLVKQCYFHEASGVIIRDIAVPNEFSSKLIEFCNHVSLPLLTIDSPDTLSEILYEIEHLICSAERRNRQLLRAIKDAVSFPKQTNRYFPALKNFGFHEADIYTIGLIELSAETCLKNRKINNLIVALESLLLKYGDRSFVLRIDNQLVFLFAAYQLNTIRHIFDDISTLLVSFQINYIGAVGNQVRGMAYIGSCYSQAKKIAGLNRSKQNTNKFVFFQDLKLERFVMSAIDVNIYEGIYQETIGKLAVFDKTYHSDLKNLLYLFLDNNCNIQRTAEQLFLHRNTAAYKLKHIEEVLDLDLADETNRVMLYLAQAYERIENIQNSF